MKKYTPKLIAFGLLLVPAIFLVIPHIQQGNVAQIIILALTLGVVALGMFVRHYRNLASDVFWFAGGAILIYLGFPTYIPDLEDLLEVLPELMNPIGEAASNGVMPVALVSLLFMQLFLRKSTKRIIILLRYLVAWILLHSIAMEIGNGEVLTIIVIPMVVTLCAVNELNGSIDNIRRPKMLTCLMFSLLCFLFHKLYLSQVLTLITPTLALQDFHWIILVLVSAALGLLIIMDDQFRGTEPGYLRLCDADQGYALLFWALTAMIMSLWPAVENSTVLYVIFPLMLHCYSMTVPSNGTRIPIKAIVIRWSLIILGLLVFAKSLKWYSLGSLIFNTSDTIPVLSVCMVLLAVAGSVCMALSRRKGNQEQVMTAFLGVAAIVLLTVLPLEDLQLLAMGTPRILVCIALSVAWCYLSAQCGKLHAGASQGYLQEYKWVMQIRKYVPLALLGITAVRILFFT